MVVSNGREAYDTLSQQLLVDEIDGIKYSYIESSRCRVCTSAPEIKRLVDELILMPMRTKHILRYINPIEEKLSVPDDERITEGIIENHKYSHLPTKALLARKLAEQNAQRAKIDDHVENLLTAKTVFELIAQKGWDGLVEGSLTPNLSETMSAVKELERIDKDTDQELSKQEMLSQVNLFLQAIKEVCPNEMWEAIRDRVQELRERQSLGSGE